MRQKKPCQAFITPLQSKMQTDQDEPQGQGDGQKETEEKTPRENEEMEVRCSAFVQNKYRVTGLLNYFNKHTFQYNKNGSLRSL